ncbi:MAG: glycerol kinase, partial [Flavobacteriales bacterium]
IKELRVDGGATVNNLLMQFQADVLNATTVRPKVVETTAMGAAFLAGLAIGYWESTDTIKDIWQVDKAFQPTSDQSEMKKLIKGWHKAISAVAHF